MLASAPTYVCAGRGAAQLPALHPEFVRALIATGQQDATRWLQSDDDGDGLWQEGPPRVGGG
jgi:hypothetical protein